MTDEPEANPKAEQNPNKKSEAEQAGILVWGRIAAMIAEAVVPIAIVRLLDKPEFGAFAALMLIYNTIAVLLTAGFPPSVLYFLADRSPGARRGTMRLLNRVMMSISLVIAAAMVLIGLLGPELISGLGERFGGGGPGVAQDLRFLPILGAFALFDVPVRLMPNMLIAEGRPRTAAGVGVVRSLATSIGTLLPAALGFGIPGILAGLAAAGAGHGLLYFGLLRSVYGPVKLERDALTSKMVIAYCIPLGATQITNTLNSSLDQWLIVSMFDAERVAVYKAGAFQIPILTTIAYTLGAVYIPRFTRLFREGKAREALEIWRASIHKVALIVVPSALIFVVGAEEFTIVAFTDQYADSAGVFRAYCFLVLGRVTAFGAVMLAAGKPGFVLRSSALTLISNALISVPLTFVVGFYGPAIGTALAFIPTLWFYNFYIAKAAGVRMRETFPLRRYLHVVGIAAIPTAAALAIKFSPLTELTHPAVTFGAEALVIIVGWALLGTWTKLILPEDWAFVRGWLKFDVMR